MTRPVPLELPPQHLEDARLYANRRELIRALQIPKHSVVAEVGVAHGDFSEFLIDLLDPTRFVAIDLFDMEKYPVIWGVPQEVLFKGMTHFNFYRHRFAALGNQVAIVQGPSKECLARLPDEYFDLIYVDAAHDYENVRSDAVLSVQKVKPRGAIVFNDYTMHDPYLQADYGVVRAVNELVHSHNLCVTGFALDRSMFCDIALRRRR
jgi:hypothetical protein